MRPAGTDAITNEWFPVARIEPGPPAVLAFRLLGERYLLVTGPDGARLCTVDTCPHRGAQLSLGTFDGATLACPYHGWVFDLDGQCVHQPAQPERRPPPGASLRRLRVEEAYGLVWVCAGTEPAALPVFEPFAAHPGRTLYLGPERVNTSAPRVVENFLDMAHFPFVHRDYLGAPPQTAVRPYRVTSTPEGLHVEDAWFHQPQSGPGTSGTDVLYQYSVPAPYAATLTKAPGAATGDDRAAFSILLVAVPLDELVCDVWLLTTVHDADADLVAYDEFNRTIFAQDIPIVESQRPRRLPVQPTEELHQRADKVSLAYRSYLKDRGVRYGTTANGGPEP